MESWATGQTTSTTRHINAVRSFFEQGKNSSENQTAYQTGKVVGDIALIGAGIYGGIKAAPVIAEMISALSAITSAGSMLVISSVSTAQLESVIAAGLAAAAAASGGSTLGNDIQELKDDLKNEHIIGENGTQVTSKTLWEDSKVGHIDVENPAPGKRPGQIHFQDMKGNKWYYDIENQQFYNQKTGELAPKSVQDLLSNERIQKAIQTGLRYLGE